MFRIYSNIIKLKLKMLNHPIDEYELFILLFIFQETIDQVLVFDLAFIHTIQDYSRVVFGFELNSMLRFNLK